MPSCTHHVLSRNLFDMGSSWILLGSSRSSTVTTLHTEHPIRLYLRSTWLVISSLSSRCRGSAPTRRPNASGILLPVSLRSVPLMPMVWISSVCNLMMSTSTRLSIFRYPQSTRWVPKLLPRHLIISLSSPKPATHS